MPVSYSSGNKYLPIFFLWHLGRILEFFFWAWESRVITDTKSGIHLKIEISFWNPIDFNSSLLITLSLFSWGILSTVMVLMWPATIWRVFFSRFFFLIVIYNLHTSFHEMFREIRWFDELFCLTALTSTGLAWALKVETKLSRHSKLNEQPVFLQFDNDQIHYAAYWEKE